MMPEANWGERVEGSEEAEQPAGEDMPATDGPVVPGTPDESASDPEEAFLAQTTPLEPLPEKAGVMPLNRIAGKTPAAETRPNYLRSARRSSIGRVRPRNEDGCLIFVAQSEGFEPIPLFGLFIVADGMGGHNDGHIASQLVSRIFAEHVLRSLYLPLLRADEAISRRPVQEVMEEAVQLANKALYTPDRDQAMGTTLTAALIIGSRLFLVHVGDSRAYMLHEDQLSLITTDHTVVQALQEAGQLTVEEAAHHPNRNLLYRALIGEDLEQIDIFSRALPARGMLALCSDGLWGLVSEPELQAVLQGEGSLQDKAENLVGKALAAGGHDNITVVLVDFHV
jgi:protein phosphatase